MLCIDIFYAICSKNIVLQEIVAMKIKKETVVCDAGQSFRLFEPRLKHYFYWHYHPEFELVYVEASNGIRHVGRHISSFMGSDLVLIGSNVPHLNFDYGLKTAYKQIVLQLQQNFLGDAFAHTPEWFAINQLFNKAYLGLSFSGTTKAMVVEKLKQMKQQGNFERLVSVLEIFQLLAHSTEVSALNTQDTSNQAFFK